MQLSFNQNSLIPGITLATKELESTNAVNADFLKKAEFQFGEQNIVAEQIIQPNITS